MDFPNIEQNRRGMGGSKKSFGNLTGAHAIKRPRRERNFQKSFFFSFIYKENLVLPPSPFFHQSQHSIFFLIFKMVEPTT
jgi:hypothetical protein